MNMKKQQDAHFSASLLFLLFPLSYAIDSWNFF